MKTWAVKPFLLYSALALGPALGLMGIAGACWVAWHSSTASSPKTTAMDQISAYEARIATLRTDLNEAQSRALVARTALEGKVSELLARQAKVEARQAIVATLAEAALPPRSSHEISVQAKASNEPAAAANPLIAGTGAFGKQKALPGLPEATTSYLPNTRPFPLPEADSEGSDVAKTAGAPGPQGLLVTLPKQHVAGFEPIKSGAQPFIALDRTAAKIEVNENQQIVALNALGVAADKNMERQKQALASAGLSLDKLTVPNASAASGGPFVPLKVDPNGSEFERAVYRTQEIIETATKLKRIMPYVPLRHPLGEGAEITSPFGGRIDPFNGQMAMHTGVDFRLEYGAAVHPTAAGTVLTAEANGGYGNMVDIDHGNGLVTRYGHLAAILVKEGDHVTPQSIIGRLGSTGRSTGPHLHYEVRVNDEAVNPMRFLKAGESIFAVN